MSAAYLLSAFSDEYADGFTEQLEGLAALGVGYTEPRFIDGENVSSLSAEKVREVKGKLASFGIGVSSIGSPLGKIAIDGDLEAHFETAKRVFDTARELGTRNVRMFSFYPPEGKTFEGWSNAVYDALDRMLTLAEERGVRLCHENEGRIYGESPEQCRELLEHFKGRLKCVFDMGNFVLKGYTPYPDAFDLLKGHIEYFHIKDALAAGAIVPPGAGEGRIADLLRAFDPGPDRQTFVTLEPHLQTFSGLNALVGGQHSFKNPYQFPDRQAAFRCAVAEMKKILAAL